MSSHSFSQSTISCTKLCIKNNFLFKLMFSAGYFSPSTICCLVGPSTLFLFCRILSLPLSPPAYFPQHSTAFNDIKNTLFSTLSVFLFIPHASVSQFTLLAGPLASSLIFVVSSVSSCWPGLLRHISS